MKFTIALITLLCVSTINSAPIVEKICIEFDHHRVIEFVEKIVSYDPDWKVSGTFRENLLNLADAMIDDAPHVDWDEELDAKANLVNFAEFLIATNPIAVLDPKETLESNVGSLVESLNKVLKFIPIRFEKTEVLAAILNLSSQLGLQGIDAEKSLHDNLEIFVEIGLFNIKVEEIHSFEDWINALVIRETENFLGFGPTYTIQDIVADFLDIMYLACVSGH